MLKRNSVLNFEEGLLTVKLSGHGSADGWATLSFREDQFELNADGHQVVEIAPHELRELRDFLNRIMPAKPQTAREKELEAALKLARDYMDVSLGCPSWDGPNPYPIIDAALGAKP